MALATMLRAAIVAVVSALIGAAAGAACLIAAMAMHPAVVFDMHRDLPDRMLSGVYRRRAVGRRRVRLDVGGSGARASGAGSPRAVAVRCALPGGPVA